MHPIRHSVGRGGMNHPGDVRVIQTLLSRHRGHGHPLISIGHVITGETILAIIDFQHRFVKMKKPDGRVDPGGKTFKMLCCPPHLMASHHVQVAKQVATTAAISPAVINSQIKKIAWGAKVSPDFKNKVIQISANLGISPDYLMACMAFETGETFSPSIRNAKTGKAVGLIQFMPDTAEDMFGFSTDKLAAMTAVEQLNYVEKYFKAQNRKLNTLEDIYMAILYPAAIGKDPDSTLFKHGSKQYEQNSGFDKNKDKIITPAEVSSIVRAKYEKGLKPGFFG